jgi:hypothetical protein
MLFRFSLAPKISKMEKKIFAFVFRSLAPLFFQQNPLTNKSVWCGLSTKNIFVHIVCFMPVIGFISFYASDW